jgi:CheY-like chemotaxis protein
MTKSGPIVVIEDDEDDRHILGEVFKTLNFANEIVFFEDGELALTYLQDANVYPFLILSDINLPRLNGFELKKMVQTNEGLSEKCIPYLFFSTSVDKRAVYDAYTMSVQGFFLKPPEYPKLVNTIRVIVEYWQECYSPSNFSINEDMRKLPGREA